MLKTHIKTRWLRLLLLVIALVGLSASNANAWNFSSNTDPKKIVLHFNNNVSGDHEMTFTLSSNTWSYEFTSTLGYVNYTIRCYWSDTNYNEYYANEGTDQINSWVNLNCSQVSGKSYYFSGLTSGTKYRIELTGQTSDNNKYRVRIVEAGPTLSAIQYKKGASSTTWSSLSSGVTLTNITSTDNYYFRALYSDNSTKNLSVSEIKGNGDYNFTEKSSATASNFASNISGAKITATSNDKLVVSNVSYKTQNITFYVNNSQQTGVNKIYVWYELNGSNTEVSDAWSGTKLGTSKTNMAVTAVSGISNEWKYVVTLPQGATLKMILNNGSDVKTSDISVVDGTLYKMPSSGSSYTTTANYTPRTVNAISLLKGGTSVGSLKDGNTLSVTGINNGDVFLVKVDYSSGDPTYHYYNGTFSSAVTNGTLSTGTASTDSWKAGDILSASFKLSTNNDLSKINISSITANSWTYTPANNTTSTSKSIVVKKTDSRNNVVYYTHAAINKAGEYTLTATDAEAPVVINMTNPSTKVTWSSGVPTLTVTDLNAGIVKVELYKRDGDSRVAEMVKHEDEEGVYFTWNGEVDRIDDNPTWYSAMFYLKATNAANTTSYWTLNGNDAVWYMGEGSASLGTKSGDKFIGFKDNRNVSIKVTLKSSNKNQLDKIYRGNAQIKIVGDVAGTNYGESDGKPLELYTINNEGKPVYRYVAGTMQGDKYCRLWINGTQKGNSAGKDQPMGGESNKSTWSNTTNEFQNTFKIPIGNAEKIVKVWVMPNDDKVWFTASDAPISLNIMPRDVREDDNNSYSAWIHDAVYITADYLNNNVLSPDWEMERRKDGTYHIENVTLRSTQSGSGAAANQNITFRVIKPDFTCTNIQINPADFVTLPSGSERQYGYAYDIVYNPSKTGNERFTFTLHKDDDGKEVGKQLPFLSLVGYNFQQNVNGVTPRGKNTDNGWQESWILCDDNGSPMLDNDDNYIYSTVWPPKNPIQFKGVFPDADDLEISSDNIIFSKAEMYDSEDNQIDPILTGAKWKTYVPFVNDINHQYDGLINGISTASSAPGMQRAAAASNGTLAANTKYMRYIVRNVWVLGSIKVWTGWGGQTINDGANWSAHANWGYLTGNDAKFDNNSGNEISSNTAYQMVGFGGNFLFDQPTYFKTVEFYIPVDDEGVPTNVNATPVFYTTVGLGDPRIQAQATKLNGTDKVNNTGRFVPMYDRAKLPDGREAVGYRITRYDATECSSNQDFSRWFPDNKNGNAEVTCTATLDDLEFNYDKMNKKQASSYLWYTEPTTLANGRYFYGLELLDANGNVIDRVASNVFTIANIDVKPSTKALQLLELTERGAELAHLESYGLSWDDKENDKWYLTYQPGNNGDYFVVNGKTKKVTEIDQKHALSAINAHEVVWTTRYFVRAGNVKKFQSDMKEAMKLGVLDAMPEDPQYKFTYTGQDGIEHTVNDNLLVKSTNGTKGYITNFTAGSLKQYTFTSKIQYSYKPKDGEIRYIRFTDEDPDKKYTHEVNTKSYIPGAYDLTYSYKTEIDNNAAFDPEVELYTTSSVFDSEGNFMTLPSNGVPANDVTPALKKIRVDNLPHRNLNCVFEFKRPNISSELLANYDIYYDVLFDNNDEHLDVLNDAYVYDPTTVAQGEKKYQVIAHQVSPKQAVYPIFVLKGTIYVRKGELATLAAAAGKTPQEYLADQRTVTETADASEYQMYHTPQYKTLTSNGYTGPMLTVEAVNVTEAKPMSINSMTPHCFPHWDGPIKYYGWAIDPGQITFTENGDYVHMDTSAEADQTAEAITMTPAYYDVEAYIPGQVGQITGWNNATNYWNVTPDKAIIEDGVITAANYYSPDHVLRANVSTLGASTSTFDGKIEVARGFLSDAKPTFIFTPVYIFCRKPRPEAQETDDDDADYIGLQVYGKPASSAPRRMGESEEDPNMPVSSTPGNVTSDGKIVPGISTTVNGVEYVVVRGGAGVQEVNATIMTGVEDINVEETTAEYYNMQGIRVPEPEHGQIYIVKYSDGRVARQLYR